MTDYIPQRFPAIRDYKDLLGKSAFLDFVYTDGQLEKFNSWLDNRSDMTSFFIDHILPFDTVFSPEFAKNVRGLDRTDRLTIAAIETLSSIEQKDVSESRKIVLRGIAVGLFYTIFDFNITDDMKEKAASPAQQHEAVHPILSLLDYLDEEGKARVSEWMKGIPANSAAAVMAKNHMTQALEKCTKGTTQGLLAARDLSLNSIGKHKGINLETRHNVLEIAKAFFDAACPAPEPVKSKNTDGKISLDGLCPPEDLIPAIGPVRMNDKKVQALFDYIDPINDPEATTCFPFSLCSFYKSDTTNGLHVINNVQADRLHSLFKWLNDTLGDKPTKKSMQALISYNKSVSTFNRNFGASTQVEIAQTLVTVGVFETAETKTARGLAFTQEFIDYWTDPQARNFLLGWHRLSKSVNLAKHAALNDLYALYMPKLARR